MRKHDCSTVLAHLKLPLVAEGPSWPKGFIDSRLSHFWLPIKYRETTAKNATRKQYPLDIESHNF